VNRVQRFLLVVGVVVLSVVSDQATKRLAVATLKGGPVHRYLFDTFRLQYAENPGAFLSLGASLPPAVRSGIFTVAVGLLLLGFAVAAFMSRTLPASRVAALAALAGGGLGNWIDRVLQDGVVVDFMNVGIGPLRTGIFNVADLAIMGGAIFLAWPEKKAAPSPAPAQPAAPPA
jgi:signal peptidase II